MPLNMMLKKDGTNLDEQLTHENIHRKPDSMDHS